MIYMLSSQLENRKKISWGKDNNEKDMLFAQKFENFILFSTRP